MKRPLFIMLTGLVLGEAFICISGRSGIIILALFMMAALIYYFSLRDKQSPFYQSKSIIILLVSFAFLGGLGLYGDKGTSGDKGISGSMCLQGRVTDIRPGSGSSLRVHLDRLTVTRRGNGDYKKRKLKGSCLVTLSGNPAPALLPDDRLMVSGKVKDLPEATNHGEFDSRVWYLGQGIGFMVRAEDFRLLSRSRWSVKALAWKVKEKIYSVYTRALSAEDAALLSAMVLGDKSDLPEEIRKEYTENGAVHLLAVSGLHVSILGGSLYLFLRKRGFGYLSSCLSGALLLLFYGCMTGFGSSVFRAVVMYLVYLLSQLTGADYDLISAMSLSGLLMLTEQPVRLFQGGFQISYISILAIGLVLPEARRFMETRYERAGNQREKAGSRRKRTLMEKAGAALFDGIVISAVTAPAIMWIYYEWAPAGILLNLILLPCMGPLMVSAICGGLAGIFLIQAGATALIPAEILLHFFHKLFVFTGSFQVGAIITGRPGIPELLFLYLAEAGLFWIWLHPRRLRVLSVLLIIILLFVAEQEGSVSLMTTARDLVGFPGKGKKYMTIHMLDVGQGECILIRTWDRKSILIDGGSSSRSSIGRYVIIPALKYYGVKKLDYVIATHMDEDHISGLKELFKEGFRADHVFLPAADQEDLAWQSFYRAAWDGGAKATAMGRGDRILFKDAELDFYHPGRDFKPEDRNDGSLAGGFIYKDFAMLFTGDLGAEGEAALMSALPAEFINSLDVLKVAHHGSRYSTGRSFLSLFPDIKAAIISAGRRNRYGHPHRELLKRLADHGIMVYDTPKQGEITLKTDGSSFFVSGFCR